MQIPTNDAENAIARKCTFWQNNNTAPKPVRKAISKLNAICGTTDILRNKE